MKTSAPRWSMKNAGSQVFILAREMRVLFENLEELASSKADCAKLRDEKLHLQMQVDEFASEKNLIAYDKERWAREKEILVQGKQWCMNEISARETKLSEMRIEMVRFFVRFMLVVFEAQRIVLLCRI